MSYVSYMCEVEIRARSSKSMETLVPTDVIWKTFSWRDPVRRLHFILGEYVPSIQALMLRTCTYTGSQEPP
jgi:hypothetical protein